MNSAVPILRLFDEASTRAFYVGFLDFTVDWEFRFSDESPLYMQVHRGDCVIQLSGHHGDSCPGSGLRIETPELDEYVVDLRAKKYKHSNPGDPQLMPWGTRDVTIADPSGNRLTFFVREQ